MATNLEIPEHKITQLDKYFTVTFSIILVLGIMATIGLHCYIKFLIPYNFKNNIILILLFSSAQATIIIILLSLWCCLEKRWDLPIDLHDERYAKQQRRRLSWKMFFAISNFLIPLIILLTLPTLMTIFGLSEISLSMFYTIMFMTIIISVEFIWFLILAHWFNLNNKKWIDRQFDPQYSKKELESNNNCTIYVIDIRSDHSSIVS